VLRAGVSEYSMTNLLWPIWSQRKRSQQASMHLGVKDSPFLTSGMLACQLFLNLFNPPGVIIEFALLEVFGLLEVFVPFVPIEILGDYRHGSLLPL
jgi:hypothetical protein